MIKISVVAAKKFMNRNVRYISPSSFLSHLMP